MAIPYIISLIIFLNTGLIYTRGYDIELRCPKFFKHQEIYDIICLVNIAAFPNYGQLVFYMSYEGSFLNPLCTVKIPPAPQNCGPVTSGCGCLESSNQEPHIFVYKYKANQVFHQNAKLSCAVPGVLKNYNKKTTESCNQLDFEGPSSTSLPKEDPSSTSLPKGTSGYDIELRCPEVFKDEEIYDLTCLVNITTFSGYDEVDFFIHHGPNQNDVNLLCTVKIPPAPQNCGPVTSGCGCVESSNREPHVFVYKYKANKALDQNGELYCTVAGVLKSYTVKTTESCKQLDFGGPKSTSVHKGTSGYDIELRCPEVFKDQEIYDLTCLVNMTTFSGYDQLDFYMYYGPSQRFVKRLCTVKIPPAPQNCGPVTSGCGCLESSNLEPHVFGYKYKANKALHQNGELYCKVAGVLKIYTVKTTESCKKLKFVTSKSRITITGEDYIQRQGDIKTGLENTYFLS